MGTLSDIGLSLAIVVAAVLVYLYLLPNLRRKSSWYDWKCAPISKRPNEPRWLLGRVRNGEVGCLSDDGVNCVVYESKDKCMSDTERKQRPNAKELQCGLDHVKKHGVSGYAQDVSWCNYILDEFNREENASTNNPHENELVT